MPTSTTLLQTPAGAFRVAIDGPEGAPVLVLSNSLGTTLEMWDAQAARLATSHRVVRYDTRGHGGSVVPPGPYRFEQLGGDVLALLDALQVERASFCGISMGGFTGLWLGVHAGHRLNHLVVANSAAKIGSEEGWRTRAAMVREKGTAAMVELAASSPGRWFTEAFVAAQPALVRPFRAPLYPFFPAFALCSALVCMGTMIYYNALIFAVFALFLALGYGYFRLTGTARAAHLAPVKAT